MPESFGKFTVLGEPTDSLSTYTAGNEVFVAMRMPGKAMAKITKAGLQDAKEIGVWTCGTSSADTTKSKACVAEAHEGALIASMGPEATEETVATTGDEFLAAWK